MSRTCPVCDAADLQPSVRRAALPVFQNIVYPTAAAARAAPQAGFTLATCRRCGFSFNMDFDASLVVYDERYDNHVASAAFDAYYRQLAQMLIDRFDLTSGTVYDIGCGKGEFLRVLCDLAPGLRGIGIDPSCTPVVEGNFELRREPFSAGVFSGGARLVLLRHVLEHIAEPRAFLAELRAAMPEAPLYVEVPDLDWILANGAFWDFCYEHCNYFTAPSLAQTLRRAGFAVTEQQPAFGGQYQWALAAPGDAVADVTPDTRAIAAVAAYLGREVEGLAAMRGRAGPAGLVLWGMATKGVVLATLLGNAQVRAGIDMNTEKQGMFAAGSGVEIHPPEWLAGLPAGTALIVMNPNYLAEIRVLANRINPGLAVVTA